jgi:sigma54-dependent transcription regulator
MRTLSAWKFSPWIIKLSSRLGLWLEDVIRTCQGSTSLSAAGRALFAASRQTKKQPNDADRLRKYLARFELSWDDLRETRNG